MNRPSSAQDIEPAVRRCAIFPTSTPPPALQLHLVERTRVEQVAELLGADELAQQVTIKGERGGPSLGEQPASPSFMSVRDPPL